MKPIPARAQLPAKSATKSLVKASAAVRAASPPAALAVDPPLTAPLVVRKAAGRARRARCRREQLGVWRNQKRDPIENLRKSNEHRLAALVPIRFGRMLQSPFTFLRGAASLMAYDIGTCPSPALCTQVCGDAHLGNFGGFASPERVLLFGVNDFDETLPGAFEWDVKRLTASFHVAARVHSLSESQAQSIVARVASAYRTRMAECAQMSALELWYQRQDLESLVKSAKSKATRKKRIELGRQAAQNTSPHAFPRMTCEVDGHPVIVDHPPLIYHPRHMPDFQKDVRVFWNGYVASMPEERQALLSRYEIVDVAVKVVGVGSVGTRCAVALLMGSDRDPLFLQFKQANASVYEPYWGRTPYANQGQRVVVGQRIMQAASDIFLGFSHAQHVNADFYVRQLRDMKISFFYNEMAFEDYLDYADACAWALAGAHAKGGDAGMISGYLGLGDSFDRAMVRFATDYADQTERDHALLARAVKSGRVKADLNAQT
jgi:uncharacterized protein (DUF2252 family)